MRDLRLLGETFAIVFVTWLLLGWPIDRAIAQADASVTWIPYARSTLLAGPDWTDHLYRFGVLGGSAMHDAGGSPPLLAFCAWLGIGPTNAANLMSLVHQVCFGFFGVLLAEALSTDWRGVPRTPSAPERIAAVWLTGFVPVLAWRLGYGHDNLIVGLLPFFVLTSLWSVARARPVSVTALGFGAFAIVTGLSSLGAQTLVYSTVFGAPIALALVFPRANALRWRREHGLVVLTAIAALLVVLPRFASMLHYQLGDDAGRGVSHALVRSYGGSTVRDWLASLPWTDALTRRWPGALPPHETNFSFGPLIVLAGLAWPARNRRLAVALALSAALAILFALDVPPVSTVLEALPMLEAFRVPARAILPLLVVVAPIAIASVWAREDAARPAPAWGAIAAGALCVLLARIVPVAAREPLAWLSCIGLGLMARWRPGRQTVALLGVIGGLGVAAFNERIPRDVPNGRIEDVPAQLRQAALAHTSELATPLVRVVISDGPPPFLMSTAFAAGLGSIDGAWFPPRRFLALLGMLSGHDVSPATGVFTLHRMREFPILQQLYNVRYAVSYTRTELEELPTTPGPAWFPARVHTVAAATDMREGITTPGALAREAWVLSDDAVPAIENHPDCLRARVDRVSTDAHGQAATLAVATPASCVLVVSTNFVRALRAIAGGRCLDVFPVDVALTGILVPPGAHEIVLAPAPYLPWWSHAAWFIGLAALLGIAIFRARASLSRFL